MGTPGPLPRRRPEPPYGSAPGEQPRLLGLPLWTLGRGPLFRHLVDSVDAAEERLANGDEPGPPLELHSVNAEISVQVRDDPRYRALLAENPLNLPDGEWIRRLAGTKYRRSFERISGSDMVGELCELAAREAWGVFLLGAAEDVSALAAERLRARYPDLALDRFSPPYEPGPEVSDATTAEVLARIEAARPTVLLAFLGSPKQELWCRAHAARLSAAGVRVALGAGAGLDFLAGRVRRAPAVVSRSGLEWLWRLAHQPRARFGRAVRRLPRFLVLALREALVGRLREAHFPQPPVHDERALGPAHGPRTKPPRTGAEAP